MLLLLNRYHLNIFLDMKSHRMPFTIILFYTFGALSDLVPTAFSTRKLFA